MPYTTTMTEDETDALWRFLLRRAQEEDARRDATGRPDNDPWVRSNTREVGSLRRIVFRLVEERPDGVYVTGDPMILQLLAWRYMEHPEFQRAWFEGTAQVGT